jgi:hypothetical protein
VSRKRMAWELCSKNKFSGIHVWKLTYPLNDTGRQVKKNGKIASCNVCGAEPSYLHRADVMAELQEMLNLAHR